MYAWEVELYFKESGKHDYSLVDRMSDWGDHIDLECTYKDHKIVGLQTDANGRVINVFTKDESISYDDDAPLRFFKIPRICIDEI